ncbi:unnamed protein product, partial [Tilletia caries]
MYSGPPPYPAAYPHTSLR